MDEFLKQAPFLVSSYTEILFSKPLYVQYNSTFEYQITPCISSQSLINTVTSSPAVSIALRLQSQAIHALFHSQQLLRDIQSCSCFVNFHLFPEPQLCLLFPQFCSLVEWINLGFFNSNLRKIFLLLSNSVPRDLLLRSSCQIGQFSLLLKECQRVRNVATHFEQATSHFVSHFLISKMKETILPTSVFFSQGSMKLVYVNLQRSKPIQFKYPGIILYKTALPLR